jgi:hypothetical protein
LAGKEIALAESLRFTALLQERVFILSNSAGISSTISMSNFRAPELFVEARQQTNAAR